MWENTKHFRQLCGGQGTEKGNILPDSGLDNLAN